MLKKGFTLIELLAVIIILAIIALIATPIILNVVEDARISAGKSEAQMIYSGINNYCATSAMEQELNGTVDICADGVSIDDVSKMINLGNSKVSEVTYNNGKITNLVVESNAHKFKLCHNGEFVVDEEECPVLVEYTDASGANKPILSNNMIPIRYDGTNWKYADIYEKWYDYNNQEWANAVVLNKGVSKRVGDTISESEIALWYVWIPRYKYQLFNVNNSSVSPQLINVEFENEIATTGNVTCVDDVSGSENSSETCINAANGNWYTHPAFTFGDEELTGFWVGKFEVSGSTNKITVKPGVSSLANTTVSNFFTAIQDIKNSYNLTGDSHMIKNMEWGAVAYLKQSKYGLGLTDIAVNDNGDAFYTGGGTGNSYKNNISQSTTGNIYGIYDMSGNAYEYVMGNMVDTNGSFYSSNAGFSSSIDEKYYDKYAYGVSSVDHGRGKLGDATKETLATFGVTNGGWYDDHTNFVDTGYSWFIRGGYYYDGSGAGMFYFFREHGGNSDRYTTRVVLAP